MFTVAMLEKIENAMLLHQTGNKVKIRLAVLNTILPSRKTTLAAILEIIKATIGENLLNNIGNSFVLENPAISPARQEPKPWYNLSMIIGQTRIASRLGETADESVYIAQTAVRSSY